MNPINKNGYRAVFNRSRGICWVGMIYKTDPLGTKTFIYALTKRGAIKKAERLMKP